MLGGVAHASKPEQEVQGVEPCPAYYEASTDIAYRPQQTTGFHTVDHAHQSGVEDMISFMIVSLNPAGRRSFRRRRSGELPSVLPVPVWQGQCQ